VAKLFRLDGVDHRDPHCLNLNLKAGFSSVFLLFVLNLPLPGTAQEAPTVDSGNPVLNVPRGNPLQGLFTPQPQYPHAQSLLNPEPTPPAPGELNPLKGLFTPQPQFVTPQALKNPDGQPQDGEVNHLTGLFTPHNQWATPQTVLNPVSEPHHLIPERQFLWGTTEERTALYMQHKLNTSEPDTYVRKQPPKVEKPQSGLGQIDAWSTDSRHRKMGGTGGIDGKNKITDSPIRTTGEQLKTPPSKPINKSGTSGEKQSPLAEALSLIALSRYDSALKLIDSILSKHPDDAQAHYVKAVALVKMRRYKDAADEYRTVLRIQPEDRVGNLARQGLKKIGFEQ
jgi:hypothetical protein